jgi:ATP-binding cassette subfamily B protein
MKKGICIRQHDATDCGAACLASVAACYGLHIPLSRIRQYAGTDKQGTSLYGLMEASRQLCFQAKGIKAVADNLRELPLPAIFHLNLESGMQHFVVVYRIGETSVRLMDPARGKMIRQPVAAFKKRWSGVVLLLLPGAEFRREDQRTPVFKRFWKLISPHRSMLVQALAGGLVYTLLGLATPVYVQKIIDLVVPDANKKLLNLLGLLMLVILGCQILAGYFKSLIALRTGQRIDAQLILGYYRHLMRLPQQFFDGLGVGEIMSRVNDAVKIRTFINDIALNLAVHALTIILSVAAMFLYCWKLALIALLTIPVYLLLYMISNRVSARWQQKIMETGAALESQLTEGVSGIATVRRFGAEEYVTRLTEKKFIPLTRVVYRSGRAGLRLNSATELNTRLLTIMVLWIGSYFVMNRELSPGALLSFYALTGYFTVPVQALIGANKMMQDALIAADRLFEIIDLETEKDDPGIKLPAEMPGGDLEFRNVHFRYRLRNKVFDGLNLIIPRWQITAIIGESGSGKSTLSSLLQRLYPLNRGNIFIGGTDIQHINLSTLRRLIAPVPQQTDLFQGTIISNIALGDEEPDMQRILQLSTRLGLHEFINRLPGQYHALVSEQGVNFSGGQKRRIAVARALYRDPEILILDEATSALDPDSEQKVQETLEWFYNRKKTIIVISHRMPAIKNCHRILLLRQGKLAAQGTHKELIQENAEYAEWMEAVDG